MSKCIFFGLNMTLSVLKDIRSFEQIFKEVSPELIIFAEGFVYDREVAKDIVQEVFIQLWGKADQICIEKSMKSYLYGSVRNHAIDYLRKFKLIHSSSLPIEYAQHLHEECDLDFLYDLSAVFQRLPPQCKAIMELKVKDGYTYEEIANEMNISVNTVKTQVKIGYRLLKEILKHGFFFFF